MTETTKLDLRAAKAGALDPALAAELEAVAQAAGCELVHAELKGNVLRLFIDRAGPEGSDGGVTLGDCEHVSRQVSGLLDVADFGKGRYVLEVSSPGLDRELYGPRDYARFTGRLVRVTFAGAASGGKKRTVVGRLREFRPGEQGEGEGEIEVVEEEKGEALAIPLDDIRMARLEIEI